MSARRPYRQIVDGVPRAALINPEILKKNALFRPTKGDILQVAFPKSGTHWLEYITQLIITNGKPISNYNKFTRNFRSLDYAECADWKSDLPIRLFITHQPLCRKSINEEGKYIYMARNPWDVCVSLYRMATDLSVYQFQDGTFEEFFEAFVESDLGYGNYFEHVISGYALKDKPNVLFVTYEELTRDTRTTVLRLARFLGEEYARTLEEDEQMLLNVLEWSKSENMRKVVVFDFKANKSPEWKDMVARNRLTSKHGYQGDRNKYALVKEAKVGSWKTHFTPHLLARLENKIRDEGARDSILELWPDIYEEAMVLARVSS